VHAVGRFVPRYGLEVMVNPVFRVVDEGAPPTLKEAQAMVDGLVELMELPNGTQLLFNEEGRMRSDFQYNETASKLSKQEIIGPAVLLVGTARWSE